MRKDQILELATQLNPDGVITHDDLNDYFDVILDAFAIHIDRERIRRGLWKKYSALEQCHPIKFKTDRVVRSLENEPTQEQIDNAIEELYDIINYSIFAVRILKGLV